MAATVVAAFGEEARSPRRTNKVILYPRAADSIEQLKQHGIQRIENYGSYWLLEATDEQLGALKKIHGERLVRADYLNKIELAAVSIDVTRDKPEIPSHLRQADGPGKRLRLVQFGGPVRPEWLEQLKAAGDVRVISYVPNNAYIVYVDEVAEKNLAGLVAKGVIQWTDHYHPYYKLSPGLRGSVGAIELNVAVVDSPEGEAALARIRSYAQDWRGATRILNQLVERIRLDASLLDHVARLPEVLWIEPVLPVRPMDEVQALILASDTNAPGFGPGGAQTYLDFLLTNVGGGLPAFTNSATYPVVDIADSGFSVGSPGILDFEDLLFPGESRVAYRTFDLSCGNFEIEQVGPDDNICIPKQRIGGRDTLAFGHGTAIASVIAGFNDDPGAQDPSGFQFGMGVSPFGRIGSTRVFQPDINVLGDPEDCRYQVFDEFCVNNFPQLIQNQYFRGGRISNNSWGEHLVVGTNDGLYNATCQFYDVGARDAVQTGTADTPSPFPLNQELIVVFANGNFGSIDEPGGFADITVTPPATAKNVISVGATESVRQDGSGCSGRLNQDNSLQIAGFSSFGPTRDGRFKPEIVAPGTAIFGLSPNFWFDFANAAPGVSGARLPPLNLEEPSPSDPNRIYVCGDGFSINIRNESSPPGSVRGTSFAAPAVSGGIQLLWWYFQNRLTNELGQALLQPSPAMSKAYLCNSARYLPIINPQTGARDTLPSIAQGMGMMDLKRMFDGVSRVIRDESTPRAIDPPLITTNPAPQQTYFSRSGQTYELSGRVASNGLPFRVTLAWTDAPGNPAAFQQLVNDLDLEVTIGGQTYKGNVFAEDRSVVGGGFDALNNMESVFLPAGGAVTSGAPYSVVVRATNIAGDGVPNVGDDLDQDFALVVYNSQNPSDVPNLATNDACQTATSITIFPFVFTNNLNTTVYHNVHPSPSAARGGVEQFFKIINPSPGTRFTATTLGSSFDTVLSVWKGDCGALVELVSNDNAAGAHSQVSWTTEGTNTYYIVAEGRDGATGMLVLNVTRTCGMAISPSSLANAALGVAYNQVLSAPGGVAPVVFAVTAGALPPGLVLSASGPISGAPTATGAFTFAVTATDAFGCSVTQSYTIVVGCPPITLQPSSLPAASVGAPYNQTITASGAAAPVGFLLGFGPLPPGLSLSSAGILSGTPSQGGLFDFKVIAVDTNGCFAERFYSLAVRCPTISLSPSALPVGKMGEPYSQQLTATGGSPPYVFAQTGGSLPAGLTVSTNGLISGTPTSPSSSFTVTATDTNGCTGSATYTLLLDDPPLPGSLTVWPESLPNGVVGQPYTRTISATGGTAPYSYAVNSGALPPGFSLTAAGMLSGTPTSAGEYRFGITAADAAGHTGSREYLIIVSPAGCPAQAILPTSLPAAVAGQAYGQTLSVSGATAPVEFALGAGALPAGMALSAGGALSGVASAAGLFEFRVDSRDAAGCAAQRWYSLQVNCPELSVQPRTLPAARKGEPYSVTLAASGGVAGYAFALSAGALPAGLTLSSDGVLSGTPTATGGSFEVRVTDATGCAASRSYTLTVEEAASGGSLIVSPTGLANAVVGEPYSRSISATGGTAPYSFAVTAGSLPLGLSLTAAGTLSGTPIAAGEYNFTIRATDATAKTGSRNYSIVVGASANVSVSKHVSVNPAKPGDPLSYTIAVNNLGPSPATAVRVTDALPAAVEFVSASSGCAVSNGTVTCELGNLGAGSQASVSIVVVARAPGQVVNSVVVNANETDPDTANNAATATASVSPPYTVAADPAAIVDQDGDVVSVALQGPGSLEVRLSGNGVGPIAEIVLSGTDASSRLTIKVKRSGRGDGVVQIGAISSSGSLKAIDAPAAVLSGAGIEVAGQLGVVRLNAVQASRLKAAGIGSVRVGRVTGSLVAAGFTPANEANPMAGGVFAPGGFIGAVKAQSFADSVIAAARIGKVGLRAVDTHNGGKAFGVLFGDSLGAVSVATPPMKWNAAGPQEQALGDFHVKR